MIARMLMTDINVDRLEVASARVSDGEKEAVKMICRYAERIGMPEKVEVLGFVDGHASLDWIHDCGCRNINLLAKGSLRHCQQQLGKSPDEHIGDIMRSLEYADKLGIDVNLYLEDWSSGMSESPGFIYHLMDEMV